MRYVVASRYKTIIRLVKINEYRLDRDEVSAYYSPPPHCQSGMWSDGV